MCLGPSDWIRFYLLCNLGQLLLFCTLLLKTALCRSFSFAASWLEQPQRCWFTSCKPSCHLLLWILLCCSFPKAHRMNHRLFILWSSSWWSNIKSLPGIPWQSHPLNNLDSFSLLHLLYHHVYGIWVGQVISPSFSQLLIIWNPVVRLMIVKTWLKSEPECKYLVLIYS